MGNPYINEYGENDYFAWIESEAAREWSNEHIEQSRLDCLEKDKQEEE